MKRAMPVTIKTELKEKSVKRRTFLGCITCRNRKVKCDGCRPKCHRCEKASRECLGYGFKLKFIDPMTLSNDGSLEVIQIQAESDKSNLAKRQQLDLMKFPASQTYTTFHELDIKLEELDENNFDGRDLYAGPFGLFASGNYSNRVHSTFTALKIDPRSFNQNLQLQVNDQSNHISSLANGNMLISEKLPSISAIIGMNRRDSDKSSPGSPISRILPLVPALELHHQRIKLQEASDLLCNSISYSSNPEKRNFGYSLRDGEIIPKPIWIHPRLEIDAILTYQTLVGSADAVTSSWDAMKKVIFAEKFSTSSELRNRITDKMQLQQSEIDSSLKKCINEVIRALNRGEQSTVPISSFTALLRSQRVQELIRLFVKSQPSVLILSYSGCVFDTIVIPLLYKIVGELMVFECSVGLPGDYMGKVSEHGIEFRDYCDVLKRTYCMVALSITSFSQYKVLFNEYGIYDGSLNLFKCYIAFREMSLVNLSVLIKPLILPSNNSRINVTNSNLVQRLIKVGLIKELVLTLILAIYQDSNVDIIVNYSLLYGVLESLKSHYQSSEKNDREMDEIWEWLRYLLIFFKSCSKIDFENYEINEEGFEDVRSDYNLIKRFEFNDYFEQNEFNRIEIKSNMDEKSKADFLSDSNDYEESLSNDSDSEEESDDEFFEDDTKLEIPKRLAKRPNIVDKPPRSFTVRFHFSEDQCDRGDCSSENEDNQNVDCCSGTIEEEIGDQQLKVHGFKTISEKNSSHKNFTSQEEDKENQTNTRNSVGIQHAKAVALGKLNSDVRNGEDTHQEVKKRNVKMQQGSHQIGAQNVTPNKKGVEVNVLTGLATSQPDMSLNEREQLSHKKGKIQVPHPSSISWETTEGRPSSIELSFGIPVSLLRLIERAVKLADHKNWCLRKTIFPRNFPKFCCDLEEDLINWKLEWDLYTENRTKGGELQFHSLFHKALYHLAVSFYNTTLMFFFRLIKEIDPTLLQNHVTSTITHLEQLRDLSLRSDFLKDMKLFPPFWCFFISGSDAIAPELRHRFDEVARKMFVAGNKWIGKQIMMEIWRTENDGNSEICGGNSWLDVLKDWEVSGFN